MKKLIRISNGWTMYGMCHQFMKRNDNITKKELDVYGTILNSSFSFGKRWCYLKYEHFGYGNRGTVSKLIKSLVEKKIISVKHTYQTDKYTGRVSRSMNEYRILEPKIHIDNFVFTAKDKRNEVVKTDEEQEWYDKANEEN